MQEEVEKAIRDLSDARAGWVTRRDAAEALGSLARVTLQALQAHAQDPDVDIRAAVNRALEKVVLPHVAPPAPGDLKALMASCARPGQREVQPSGEGFVVTVKLAGGREQRVYVAPLTRKDGKELLRIYTWCGDCAPELMPWMLQNNAKLTNCAFALLPDQGVERVALVEQITRAQATPQSVKSAVKEIAWHGDWLERKISGRDDL